VVVQAPEVLDGIEAGDLVLHVLPGLGPIVFEVPQGPDVHERVFEQVLGAHGIVAGGGCRIGGCSVSCGLTSLLGILLGLDLLDLGLGGNGSRSGWFRTTLLAAGGAGLLEKKITKKKRSGMGFKRLD